MAKTYGVSFKDNGKIYNFNALEFDCPLNVTVIVETERGLQFGKIIREEKFSEDNKEILRIATKSDYNLYLNNLKLADEALKKAKKIANELNLNMSFIDSSFTFDKNQLLLNYTSAERIDFRELAKKLASIYKTRIELRQIGARDKARSIGGLGPCGKELCCKQFLKNIDAISMNMAKNQHIALNPTKINGCCGRLLCCLTYEDEEYQRCINDLPTIGSKVIINGEEGIVRSIDILNRKYKVQVNNEIIEEKIDD